MIVALATLLPLLLGGTVEVPAGGDLGAAVASARPGDLVHLGPGVHHATLGRVRGGLRVAGAGAGVTVIEAPEGEDGLVVEAGTVSLRDLTVRAGPAHAALKVLGGEVSLDGVALSGGAAGAYVGGGRLEARELDLSGGYGLLIRAGEVVVEGGRARGGHAGIAQLGGRLELRRVAVTGPAAEAGVTLSGGEAVLEAVAIRSPGPSGLSVASGAKVRAWALDVSGAREAEGAEGAFLGDCVQVRRADLSLEASTLSRCGGAAVEAAGGKLAVRGVDASGGAAGCLVFLEGAGAELVGNRCVGRGPAVVAASGAQVTARMDRWRTDPVLWVECGSGARVRLGPGEEVAEPCRKGGVPLDKTPHP